MNFEIIDAHVHPFSPECGANIARFGHPADTAQFVEELKKCGISRQNVESRTDDKPWRS